MDQVIASYKDEEIAIYQQQVEAMKDSIRLCNSKNAALISKVRELENIIEKANVANQDLNQAFEHVHQENLRLQMTTNTAQHDALAVSNPKPPRETDDLASESLVWISEREQFQRRSKFLERECERYHRDNTHLGKQVRHLLRTLEEERGMIVRHASQVPDDRVVCAADVIDKHLLTFESIEELQQQNQKLLSLVKNLSAEQEEREERVESEEVKRLSGELESLKSQMETIKGDRERVLKALTTIHKERDLFKILLCKTRQVEHMTPEIFQRMVSVACSSGPAITNTEGSSTEREAHIEDLRNMISNLEQNISTTKSELEQLRTSSAAELQVKNELLEKAHSRILEIVKEQEAHAQRTKLLETNLEALTTEYDELRTKHQKASFELEHAEEKEKALEQRIRELEEKSDSMLTKMLEAQQAQAAQTQLLETNRQALSSELDELKTNYQKVIFELEQANGKERVLEQRINELEGELTGQSAALAQAQEDAAKLASQGAALAQAREDAAKVATQGAALAKAREDAAKLASLSAALAQAREEVTKLSSQNAALAQAREDMAKLQQEKNTATSKPESNPLEAQVRELQARLAAQEIALTQAQDYVNLLQEQRNLEKANRLKLDRLVSGSPLKILRTKITKKRRRGPYQSPVLARQEKHQDFIPQVNQEPIPQVNRESISQLNQGPVQETVQESVQDVNEEPVQLVYQELTQELNQEPIQEVAQVSNLEVHQESIQESVREMDQELIQEMTQEPIPGVIQESIQDVQMTNQNPDPVQEPPASATIKLKRRNLG